MKHARMKASSGAKQLSGVLAQIMAVTAMLIIAALVFYVR